MNRTTSNMDSFGKKYIFLKLFILLLGTEVILSDKQCDCESLSFLTELVQQEIFQRKLDYMKLRSELRRLSKEQKVVTPTTAETIPTIGISDLEKDKPTPAVEQGSLDYLEKQLEAKLQSGFDEFEKRTNDIVRTNAKLQLGFDELEKRTNETCTINAKLQSGFNELEKSINAERNKFFKQTITNALKKEKHERVNFISRIQSLMENNKGAFDVFKTNISENFKDLKNTITTNLEEHVLKIDQELASQKNNSEQFEKRVSNKLDKYEAKVRGDIETAGHRTQKFKHNMSENFRDFKNTITSSLKEHVFKTEDLIDNKIGAYVEMNQKFERNISENFKHLKNTLTTSLKVHVLKIGQDLADQKNDSDLFEKKVSNELDKFKSKVNDEIETAEDRTALSITKLLSTLKNSTKNINECLADIETIKDAINDITSDTQRDKKAIKELRNEFDDNVAQVNRIFSSNAKKLELTRDCKDILRTTPDAKSGQYIIFLRESNKAFSVYCDMETDGGGWTVFQRRFNGETDFNRTYDEYVNGFGTVSGEFWLGLKNIQEFAKQGVTELRLDMTDFSGAEKNEIFNDFKLFDPEYKLYLGLHAANSECTGRLGMLYNNRSGFSTYDHEVDTASSHNCGSDYKGGWWYVYKWCSIVELNGVYSTSKPCMFHYGFGGQKCLKSTSMMLRRTL